MILTGVAAGGVVTVAAGPGLGALVGLAVGLGFAVAIGPVVSEVWRTAIGQLCLTLRYRTPLRLVRFLDDARSRHLLRTVGPIYQFRHATLQDRLAVTLGEPPSTPGRPG